MKKNEEVNLAKILKDKKMPSNISSILSTICHTEGNVVEKSVLLELIDRFQERNEIKNYFKEKGII